MSKGFSGSLASLMSTLARIMGKEVSEGQVDVKMDYRWWILIVLLILAVVLMVWSFVSIRSPLLMVFVVLCGGFGLYILMNKEKKSQDEP